LTEEYYIFSYCGLLSYNRKLSSNIYLRLERKSISRSKNTTDCTEHSSWEANSQPVS